MTQSINSYVRCDYCLGMVPDGEAECLRCGAPLESGIPDQEYQEMTLAEFVEACDQKLVDTGTSAAELAFGVGCTLGVLVAGMLMVLIFFAFTKTWTILVVILFILTLISFLVSSILATRARSATTRRTYEREVKPEIEVFIASEGIGYDDFIDQASEILPASSPMLVFSTSQKTSKS
jgi:hypothetical protein